MSDQSGAFSQIVAAILADGWNKNKIIGLLLIIIFIMGLGYVFFLNNAKKATELAIATQDSINPPTPKAEDLRVISKKLTSIAEDLQVLRNDVDSKISTDNMIMRCGINNQELNKWEVSVSGKNTYKLKEGDQILLINSYSPQIQSAKFRVKFVRDIVEAGKPEIYINLESAQYFAINDPDKVGIFDLKIQRLK